MRKHNKYLSPSKLQLLSRNSPVFYQIAVLYLIKMISGIMKGPVLFVLTIVAFSASARAQAIKANGVPASVKEALAKKYPKATKVNWEKEKGNYEANWGGKSGEDTSVQFTPAGGFVEEVNAIGVGQLPVAIVPYVKAHYKGARIKEAGKVTDAAGKHFFEAEIKGKDLIFDASGKFLRKD